jgi:hypothetical protein
MDPVALAAAALLVVCAGLAGAAWSARASRRRASGAVQRSRDEMAALAARVDELSGEVDRVRRAREEEHREYVITTLAPPAPDQGAADVADAVAVVGPGATGALLQRRLVTAIRRTTANRPAEEVLVALAVRTVAVGHGVRRALSPANRDRIAWEMRRAARESRRARKQEVRAARRQARARRLAAARKDAA